MFFEGPPTANGRPGIHHVFSRTIKDMVCRYHVMLGQRVTRIGGWDTHGLPVELEVEKQLGFKGKKDIEAFGVAEFNRRCLESVFTYRDEWVNLSNRIGYWLDYDHAYVTCTREYIESVWWLLKQLHTKQLLYRGHRVLPYCPRCGTTLSSHELALGYEEVRDKSVYVTVPVDDDSNRELVVWTTTPWTLPSNVAIAVHPDLDYGTYRMPDGRLLVAATSRSAILEQARGCARARWRPFRDAHWSASATAVRSTWCRSPRPANTPSWSPAISSPRATAPAWCTWRRRSDRTITRRDRRTAWRCCAQSPPTARFRARPGPSSRASW